MRSSEKPFYVGADGCKGGWFAIVLTQDGQWQTEVFRDISTLWEKYHKASLILLDVPIGLKESGADERCCDKEARMRLGPSRASSVFPAPCRQAIYAGTYAEASAINEQITGRRLSHQTWGIIPKIREVDTLLLSDATVKAWIKEVHPEVCFWALAGRPMEHKKGTASGFSERLQVLQYYYEHTEAIVTHALEKYRRKDVKKDDILDALIAAVTALGPLNSLPDPPESPDNWGLPMQMLYHSFDRG